MPQVLARCNPSCFFMGMNKNLTSPRMLARKKREAKALKANMQKRKEAAKAKGAQKA